ncbi:Phosphoribosylaminoimidazole-succinocarboxamide synthase [Candidatus Arcanobacter lacustris]|jgi:phosphoribosylaminoimidazole-succinocarboxamide synthase|uniref:Phosphoribosylaminoimidazole-succinocarboxamide synthase n=1 Tax=Candidatus Arcanibacter lacustris TaxID=1607817 RepID=A0A0F5MMY3_9RICK|nr:Phosphoribosylaminoimidazole-succinocarboxamide synthase [Candidatus Arcanobacter lacustris]
MASILKMNLSGKRKQLYEGSSKILFEGPDSDTIIAHFKDEVTVASTNETIAVAGKGALNNRISEYLMLKLDSLGIATHFIKNINMREQLVRRLDVIPLQVVIRNVAAGDICTRFGMEEGVVLPKPIIEFFLKSTNLKDPLVTEDHIEAFGWAGAFEMEEIRNIAIRANDFLTGLFLGCGIRLIDFKLEFGRSFGHDFEQVIIADEITPDTCRLWDMKTNVKMDQEGVKLEGFPPDKGYLEIARRLGILPETSNVEELYS